MKLVIRWLIGTIAVAVATWLLPGIRIEGSSAWLSVIVVALILGLVNAIIRPILVFLSCGFIAVTLGLFMLIVNGAALLAASWAAINWFNIGFYVDGWWPAILGSIVISIVTFLLSEFLR